MSRITRRDFLKYGVGSAAALSIASAVDLGMFVRRAAAAGQDPFPGIVNLASPLFSQPAMLKTGDAFPIKMKPGASLSSAALIDTAGKELKLTPEKDGDGWRCALPSEAAPGVYHLRVMSSGGLDSSVSETQPRAVAVFDTFKDDFDFVFVADIHFGEHEGTLPDTPITPDMAQYYKMHARALTEIEKLKPEFIVLGGDLALYPRNYHLGFPEGYAFLLNYLRRPLHIVPGNHDSYHMNVKELGDKFVDAFTYWNKYYGGRYHSFDYGKLHVCCANTSDWPENFLDWGSHDAMSTGTLLSSGFSKEQFMWMKADLESATARGATNIGCMHIPLHNYISGKKIGLPAQKIPGAPEDKVFELLTSNGVEHVYVGHLHINDEKKIAGGKINEHMIRNVGGDYFEPQNAGFAVVHVRGGKIAGHDLVELKA